MRKTILTNGMVYSYATNQAISPSLMLLQFLPLCLVPLVLCAIVPVLREFLFGPMVFCTFIIVMSFFLALIDESTIKQERFDINKAKLFYHHIDGVYFHSVVVKEKDETGKMRAKRKKYPFAYYIVGSGRYKEKIICRISDELYDECKEHSVSELVVLKIKKGFIHSEYYAFHPDYFENQSSIPFPEAELKSQLRSYQELLNNLHKGNDEEM